jgi:hypothetical protein
MPSAFKLQVSAIQIGGTAIRFNGTTVQNLALAFQLVSSTMQSKGASIQF